METRPRGGAPQDPQANKIEVTLMGDAPIFVSNEGDHSIWAAESEDGAYITVQGAMAHLVPGESMHCEGRWKEHASYGWGFHVDSFKSRYPVTRDGVVRWLSAKIPGVGPAYAGAIADHFGPENVFKELDKNPEKLKEVRAPSGRAMTDVQIENLAIAWEDARARRVLDTNLMGKGVTAGMIDRLYRTYGSDTMLVLETEPYRISEIPRIGFKTADMVARALGRKLHDPERIKAGLLWVMEEAESNGNTYLPLADLFTMSNTELLERKVDDPNYKPLSEQEKKLVAQQAALLRKDGKIVIEDDPHDQQRVYRKRIWEREVELAERIRWIIGTTRGAIVDMPSKPQPPKGMSVDAARSAGHLIPTDRQWAGVRMAMHNRLSILTGGPGVGKSASVGMIIDLARRSRLRVKLAAPTGKAARRMTELSGHEATTIHRLLEWSPIEGGFSRGPGNPIDADLLVIDESSMLSLELAHALFSAIGEKTHVLMVGDVDQLPPIGAGKVLDDLIRCGSVPTTNLKEIFRQAAGSMIIMNAHRINSGHLPFLKHSEAEEKTGHNMLRDFFWLDRSDPQDVAETIVEWAVDRLPDTYPIPLDPLRDIQVLAPMKAGPCGLENLNAMMQARLNPKGKELNMNKMRVGDKVLQTVNDYETETMNGEIGIIIGWDEEGKRARLSLDDGTREIWIPINAMESFILGYAITIHKSQGSQFKAVLLPCTTGSYIMNTRNLYYTGITRAEKVVMMIGQLRALSMSIATVDGGSSSSRTPATPGKKKEKIRTRYSTLALRITNPRASGQMI